MRSWTNSWNNFDHLFVNFHWKIQEYFSASSFMFGMVWFCWNEKKNDFQWNLECDSSNHCSLIKKQITFVLILFSFWRLFIKMCLNYVIVCLFYYIVAQEVIAFNTNYNFLLINLFLRLIQQINSHLSIW